MTAATIIFGNLAALGQQNVKRLIGLSGVSHAGFLMLGVIAALHPAQKRSTRFIFISSSTCSPRSRCSASWPIWRASDDADQELDHYGDLAKQNPFLAAVLAVGLGSLAGIPPLAGFMGKLFVFVAAFKAGLYALLGICDLGRRGLDLLLFRLDQGRVLPGVAGAARPKAKSTRPGRTPRDDGRSVQFSVGARLGVDRARFLSGADHGLDCGCLNALRTLRGSGLAVAIAVLAFRWSLLGVRLQQRYVCRLSA